MSSMRVRPSAATAALLAGLAAAAPGRASDGVLEINQARALAGAVTPGDAPGFPVTLRQPGSYRLTGSLVISDPSTSAIVVEATHVTIDLNGFSIIGPATCTVSPYTGATTSCTPVGSAAGISGFVEDISVAGGSIQGMPGYGIELGSHARVERITATRNARGGIFARSGVITRSSVSRNGGNGIESGGVVSENEVGGNAGIGILSSGLVIANAVASNQGGGASLNPRAGFQGNQFLLNGGPSVLGGTATGGNACDDGRCRDSHGRRYYLSRDVAAGSAAQSLCAPGFHLASLFEILDPTRLEYDTALGSSQADSGKGPPSALSGWIRTGFASGSSPPLPGFPINGQSNCNAWSGGLGGEIAALASDWSSAASGSRFAAWNTTIGFCAAPRPAWCVQD